MFGRLKKTHTIVQKSKAKYKSDRIILLFYCNISFDWLENIMYINKMIAWLQVINIWLNRN